MEQIQADIGVCARVIQEKNAEKQALQRELCAHPDMIARQLALWDVPARGCPSVTELTITHDPCVACDSQQGQVTELEEWSFCVTIDDRHCYRFCASRWTGQAWDCFGFFRLDGDAYSELSGDALWDAVMRENARCDSPLAASCDIEFGAGEMATATQ